MKLFPILLACGIGWAQTYQLKQLVPPSNFHGVHGLRFDAAGNLYAASVIGESIYKIDINTKKVTTFIAPPDGMADDLDFTPAGDIAWSSIEDGIFHYKAANGPIQKLMENQKGVNAVSFSPDGKRLFVSLVFYGDALFEVDRTGKKAPRKIIENMGGLNGFQVGGDGMIYGPLWFKGKVVRINPDSGELKVIAEGFKTPAAVKLLDVARPTIAIVADAGTHEIIRLDLTTGAKQAVAKIRSDIDNLAINKQGRVFVSLSHLNAIDEVDLKTGKVTTLIADGALTSTAGLAVTKEGGREVLWLADVFGGVRKLDPATGKIQDTPAELFQPAHVSLNDKHAVFVSQVSGYVQVFDRASNKKLSEWSGLNSPGDALEAPNGDVIVAETGSGRLLRLTPSKAAAGGASSISPGPPGSAAAPNVSRKVIASSLAGPIGLAWAGADAVYVTETRSGVISRVDLKAGAKAVVAQMLQNPEGIAVSNGQIYVVEVGAKRLTRIEPASGTRTVLATKLPIGLSYGPSLYRGVAVSGNTIYINSDIENSVYRLTPQ